MRINPPQQFTAKLKERIEYNPKFTLFQFEVSLPHRLDFIAGQYVSLKVSAKGDRRSYSIVTPPELAHQLDLLIDQAPNGLGCQYLRSLEFGQEVPFLAPLGLFFVADQEKVTEEQLVFIATGSGIAPFQSMILDQLQTKKDPRAITLYWGLRHESDLFLLEQFQELAETHPNFTFYPILSQAQDDWNLSRGRVTDIVSVHTHQKKTGFYLCGNPHMIKDMEKILLNEKNVLKENIHQESFF